MSSSIVEKHDGRVQVRSCTAPGKCGTVFSIFLPTEHGKPELLSHAAIAEQIA